MCPNKREWEDDPAIVARIEKLSDDELRAYYLLFSSARTIVNAPALPRIEREIKARGLALPSRSN